MSSHRPRILIADQQTLMAELCKQLLEIEFNVAGIVSDGKALVLAAAKLRPDVILMDVVLPILNGLDAGKHVKQMLPAIKLVYLSATADPDVVACAFHRGASGYVLKTCSSSELVVSVREVLRGSIYVSRALPRDRVNFLRRQQQEIVEKAERLTDRQREVLQLLAEGKVMKEVGDILNMTARTVAFHKYRIMEVLGAKSSAELVRYAVREHLIVA